jgi:asparagine synthase (glutamine-hydrolysing)
MCGTAGYVGTRLIEPQVAERYLRLMRHRGPDAQGLYRAQPAPGRHLLLLHRRLSIIDPDERAHQPLRCGRAVMVCNGELYHFPELRQRFGFTSGALRTRSDTEVLLRVLLERGWRGLDECEGMWALGLYDEEAGTLLLARDRFGEKPLHLLEADGGRGALFDSQPVAHGAIEHP